MNLLARLPYGQPQPDEGLVGDLRGACLRRSTIQHRPMDQVLDDHRIVKVLRMGTHDE